MATLYVCLYVSVYNVCIYMRTCVFAHVIAGTHTHACVCMLEGRDQHQVSSSITLYLTFYETGSFTETGAH